jgi:hypothetical protein
LRAALKTKVTRTPGPEFMNEPAYGQSPDDSLELWIDGIRLIGIVPADVGLLPKIS